MKDWILNNCFRKDGKITSHSTRKKWFESKKHLNEYDKILNITNFLPGDCDLLERFYCILNDVTELPKCKQCNNQVPFGGTLKIGYYTYCSSKCSQTDKELQEIKNYNYRKNCLEKYGVNNISHLQEVKNKISKKNKGIKRKNILSDELLDEFYNLHINNEIPITILSQNLGFASSTLINTLKRRGYKTKIFSGSHIEKKIREFLIEENIKFDTNDRNILNGKELDIVLNEYKVAVEINGLYWHNDQFKDKNHLLDKSKLCNEKGIKLLHFFDSEIENKFDIVCSIIFNSIGKSKNKIFARRTSIEEISSGDAKLFFDENHIQGGVFSKYNLALKYDNEIVSVMSISKSRYTKNNYELVRFANKKFTNVIGGFSRLLKHIIKINNIEELISYVDIRFFDGHGYEKCGFIRVGQSKPNYFYFDKKEYRLHSRIRFQKHKLKDVLKDYDKNKSEYQNMLNNNYLRVFDCGNYFYKYNK